MRVAARHIEEVFEARSAILTVEKGGKIHVDYATDRLGRRSTRTMASCAG
jgi:hypothetical protein